MADRRWWRTSIWRAPTPRSIRRSARTCRGCAGLSGSSPHRAAFPATSARPPPDPFMRAGSWATRWRTPPAPCWTIPELIAACVIGDGEAETGPLAASWKAPAFLNPARDGAVLPILHLNGNKISGPTVLGRQIRRPGGLAALRARLGSRRRRRGPAGAGAPRAGPRAGRRVRTRSAGSSSRPASRAWTPGPLARDHPAHAQGLDRSRRRWTASRWRVPSGRTRCRWPASGRIRTIWPSWRPGCVPTGRRNCSTKPAGCIPELAALAPEGDLRMGATPYARGGDNVAPLEVPAAGERTPSRSACPAPPNTRRPGRSANCCGTSTPPPSPIPASGSSARTKPTATGSARCSR